MNTWQNGCFGKMNDHPVHNTQNHHPPKIDVLPKTVLQIIIAAKKLVRHSSTRLFPKQQPQPLPSLLFDSPSMGPAFLLEIRCRGLMISMRRGRSPLE